MLAFEQCAMVDKLVKAENADEVVDYLITAYGNSVENLSKLLKKIPNLAEKQVQIKQKSIMQYAWSTDLLIGEYLCSKGKKATKSERERRFPMLLYTCKVHFNGIVADENSALCKEFFDELVTAIKNKEGFDYENESDWEWLVNTAQCDSLVLEIVHKYIDAEFEPPKVRKKQVW